MKKRSVLMVATIVLLGLVVLWGCPKKASITGAPEDGQENAQALSGAGAEDAAAVAKADKEAAATVAEKGLQPIYFDFDRSHIRSDARSLMKANGGWLKANPKVNVRIEGNCDERGTREYNQALGQRRAASAKKYLTDMGISAKRVSLISYGKEKAVCNSASETCWQRNRRDDLIAVTK
jgi:peptidoglycan-associated lipoprotein